MFELALECTSQAPTNFKSAVLPFRTLPAFAAVEGQEVNGCFTAGSYRFLTREQKINSHYKSDNYELWVFGSVFTRSAYAKQLGKAPYRLYAKEIYNLLLHNSIAELSHLIKGSYVLIWWNNATQTLFIKTDRHNVLPIYYIAIQNRLYISSNIPYLLRIANIVATPNTKALASQLIFDYPIGDQHFIDQVKRFLPAHFYTFCASKLNQQCYWSVTNLHHDTLLNEHDSLEALAGSLYENVALYTSDAEKVLVSLTGGFDGRTNVAMLRKEKSAFLTYSYGMPGSLQVSIPQEISRKTGIPYRPVSLDNAFLEQYAALNQQVVLYSNGLAPLGFENIPYAFAHLRDFSDTVITGLFGSELLRPLNPGIGIQMNDRVFDLFFKPNAKKNITTYARSFFKETPLSKNIITEGLPEILEEFHNQYVTPYQSFNTIKSSFFFLMLEGLPKYFQQEIQIERAFVTTRFPYYDSDFIDLIYQTPFAGMYNGFLEKSRVKRRKGQLLYAHIMEKYYPTLNRIKADRMYKPIHLLYPFPLNYALLALGVWRKKHYMRQKGGNDTFKTGVWAKPVLNQILQKHAQAPKLDLLLMDGNQPKTAAQDLTYRYFISIIEFFNQVA